MKNAFINRINNSLKKDPKVKGITIKLSKSDYDLIKLFCKENNYKMSDILNIKICEIIEEIKKYNNEKSR